jgi:hypothetical protein
LVGLELYLSGLNHIALNKNAAEVRQARHPLFIASNDASTDSGLYKAGKQSARRFKTVMKLLQYAKSDTFFLSRNIFFSLFD